MTGLPLTIAGKDIPDSSSAGSGSIKIEGCTMSPKYLMPIRSGIAASMAALISSGVFTMATDKALC